MSGYCRGCGNTLCICKLINSNVSIEEHHKTYEQLYFESLKIISEAQKQLKESEIRCNAKDAIIEYLEGFINFCEVCKNPSNDCLC